MAAIAGLRDFRKQGAPGDIGTFVQPATAIVFQFTFSGTTTIVAMAVGVGGWVLIDQGAVVATVINAALTEVGGADDGEVVVHAGAYTVLATLNVPESVLFRGLGWATIFNYNAGGNCVTITGDNVKIRDFKVVIVAGAGGAGTRPNAVYATARTNIEITYLWLVGDKTVADDGSTVRQCGVVFDTVTYSKISACSVNNNKRYGHYLYDSSDNNTVTGNTCNGNVLAGMYIHSGSQDNTVTGNICNGNEQNGIHLRTAAPNNTVTGNTCNDNGYHGIYIQSSQHNTVTGNTCKNNTQSGIYVHDGAQDNTVTGNTCNDNTQHGIRLHAYAINNTVTGNTCNDNTRHGIIVYENSDNNTVTGNTCNENDRNNTGTYDGINIDNNADDNLIIGNTCNDNDRFGIRINQADCDRNWVKNNQLRGNTSGPFYDGGTDTKLAVKVFQFTEPVGTADWQVTSPAGIVVNAADEGALALGEAPLEVQMVVRFRVKGVGLAAPGAAKGMLLEININAGKPTGHEAYNAEAIAVASVISTEDNFAINDAVEWIIDASDDDDVDDIEFGETIEMFAMFEDTGADSDIATNAVIRTISMEYV